MVTSFNIAQFDIRIGAPCFIIAEIGVNHNGQLDIAKQLVDCAFESGANAVKFQTFKAEEFVGDDNQTHTYKSQGREITESAMEMFKRYELSRDEFFLRTLLTADQQLSSQKLNLNQS